MPFRQDKNFGGNQIKNFSIEQLTDNPIGGDLFEGRSWINTTTNVLHTYQNGATRVIAHIDDSIASLLNTYSATKIEQMIADVIAGNPQQADVISLQIDNTLDPSATPVTGDRYALNDVLNLNANFGTIAGVGNGDIVEYDGAEFVVSYDASVQNPNGGTFVWIDDVQARYYLNSSLQWTSYINSASTTVAGIVELATQTEVEATVDSERAVTPASLVQFTQIRVLTNQSFVVDTPKILTHGFGNNGVIQQVNIFPTGTNSDGDYGVDFENNGDGTVSITLNSIDGNPFDVYFAGTNS